LRDDVERSNRNIGAANVGFVPRLARFRVMLMFVISLHP